MNPNLETYKFFVGGIIKQLSAKNILEIGLGPQNTTAEYILSNFPDVSLIVIDILEQKSKILTDKYQNLEFYISSSNDIGHFSKQDMVLIDGDHSYEGVLNDIKNCTRFDLLKKDGYFIFHDTNAIQIKQALHDAKSLLGLNYFNLESINIAIGNY